jgi:hypothetical protein
VNDSRSDDGDDRGARADAWAISSTSILQELNRMHESRTMERDRNEASQSLLKALGPDQKGLFTTLCTADALVAPVMTPFMSTVTMTKTPQKAVSYSVRPHGVGKGHFRTDAATVYWPTDFCLRKRTPRIRVDSRFPCSTVDMGAKALDVDDTTVEYYAKQGFFHATNQHDLRVQLQTALEMLELLTCQNSIATRGLHYILEPKRWRRFSTVMHGRFFTDKSFGTKFLYSIDRALQMFFERVSSIDELDGDLANVTNLLLSKAVSLMTIVEYGETLAIELPALLAQNAKPITASPKKKKPQQQGEEAAPVRPRRRRPLPVSITPVRNM